LQSTWLREENLCTHTLNGGRGVQKKIVSGTAPAPEGKWRGTLRNSTLPAEAELDSPSVSQAVDAIRNAEDRDVYRVRMTEERVLNLETVRVLAAANQHILRSVDEEIEVLLIDPGCITGISPAFSERRGAILGLVGGE